MSPKTLQMCLCAQRELDGFNLLDLGIDVTENSPNVPLCPRQFEIDFLCTVSERIFSRPNQKFANTGCNGANRIQGTRRKQAARRRRIFFSRWFIIIRLVMIPDEGWRYLNDIPYEKNNNKIILTSWERFSQFKQRPSKNSHEPAAGEIFLGPILYLVFDYSIFDFWASERIFSQHLARRYTKDQFRTALLDSLGIYNFGLCWTAESRYFKKQKYTIHFAFPVFEFNNITCELKFI